MCPASTIAVGVRSSMVKRDCVPISRWRAVISAVTRRSGRRRRVLLDELLSLQLDPKLGRNSCLHRGHVGENLLFAARPDNQSRGDVRGRGKMERRGSKVYAV